MSSLSIVKQSNDLVSAYGLWVEERRLAFEEELNATGFLLWYAVISPHCYRRTLIDRDIFDLITRPTPPYLSLLELYVAGLDEKLVSQVDPAGIYDVHFWYYASAVRRYGLAPFVTEREIVDLSRMPGRRANKVEFSISLLDEIARHDDVFAKASNLAIFKRDAVVSDLPVNPSGRNTAGRTPKLGRQAQARRDGRQEGFASGSVLSENDRPERFFGLNLIGFANAVLGLGEDLQSFLTLSRRIGAHVAVVDVPLSDEHATLQSSQVEPICRNSPIFPTSLFCMPLFETERFRLRHGDDYLRGRYNIGNWAWELSALPAHWRHAFDCMDEVWAISPWLQQAYASLSRKPVVYMPPLVHLPAVERFDLAELGFSESHFVFLTFCDFNSYSARKNPVGAVRAFQRAFPARTSSERLIVKTLNGHSQTESLKQLLLSIDDDPRVIVVDGAYSRPKTLGLLQAADCFVSLHRSEGFGRVIAESMLLETPVIATGYSGSNVLLDESTGFAVDYELKPVEAGAYGYSDGCVWADPRLDDAVDRMRFVADNGCDVAARVREGLRRVKQNHGLETVAENFRTRLGQILGAGAMTVTDSGSSTGAARPPSASAGRNAKAPMERWVERGYAMLGDKP